MELTIPAGTALKNFTRSLACLTKFGQDIDISATRHKLKLSSVNPSRSAFGLVAFNPAFFSRYDVQPPDDGRGVLSFCVTAKALLSPLRPKSANTIESVTILLTDSNPDRPADGADSGECRLVVRLHCQHGVIKTHRLTYGSSSSLYAKANRSTCTSFWIASSRVLKDWIDHFHLRTGSSGGTDEISFYHNQTSCRLKSFGADPNMGDALSSRPLGTELTIDIEDFDKHQVEGAPVITFALKEFKAIITLSDSLVSTLDVAFSTGGSPILIETEGDDFVADFVIATTDFDSGSQTPSAAGTRVGVKREEEASGVFGRRRAGSEASGSGSASGSAGAGAASRLGQQGKGKNAPLFNPPSPSQQQQQEEEEDEDEYGDAGMMEFDEGALAEIDRMSQVPPSQVSRRQTLVPNTDTTEGEGEARGLSVGLGPTQRGVSVPGTEEEQEETRKKPKWNLFGD